MTQRNDKHYHLVFLAFLSVGVFFRFFNLNWGGKYSFHPDENNIVWLADSLLPSLNFQSLSRGTFSYGSFLPYLAAVIRLIFSHTLPNRLILRITSAIFSTLSLPMAYYAGKKYGSKKVGLLTMGILALSPGAVQAAHFGTFESTLTFLYLLTFWFTLLLFEKKKASYFFLSFVSLAIASAIKISSLVLLPLPALALMILPKNNYRLKKKLLLTLLGVTIFGAITICLSLYYITPEFWRSFGYEQQLVRGKTDIFYTRQFLGSKPIIFQFQKIFPFLVNPLMVIAAPIAFVVLLYNTGQSWLRNKRFSLLLGTNLALLYCLSALFFPNAFLFTKWTRYMIPVIPFLILLVSTFFTKQKKIPPLLIIISFLTTLAFMGVYFRKDIRVTASEWISQNLEKNSFFLSESGNVTNFPLLIEISDATNRLIVKDINFYRLDEDPSVFSDLVISLEKSNYLLIPSRRVFANHPRSSYPKTACYYQLLFADQLGFEKIKEFNSYPSLGNWSFPDEWAEETWSVFDHPVIRIFQKTTSFTAAEYQDTISQCASQEN